MNKKVLTLCASFLLAGGLTSQAFAERFSQAVEGQYYYVYVEGGSTQIATGEFPVETATTTLSKTSGVLDVNGPAGSTLTDQRWSYEANRSTWWRVEVVKTGVNDTERIIGYKLVNALTGKPLTVTKDGKTYDTFTGTADGAYKGTYMQFAKEDGSAGSFQYYCGTDKDVVPDGSSSAWRYNLVAVSPENLLAEEINKVQNGYFGLQFGQINDKGEYVNYESLEGVEPFSGQLVAYDADNDALDAFTAQLGTKFIAPNSNKEEFMLFNKSADKYVVLLQNKWSKNNTNHDPKEDGNGHMYALMTAKEIIEDQQSKEPTIASYIFSVNMPVVRYFSPLEVIAKQAIVNADGDKEDLEMYIANMGGVDYLTTTKAEGNEKVDGTNNELEDAVDPVNTVVRFGMTDYTDMSEFYGYAITIKGVAGAGVEGMTLRPDIEVSTNIKPTDDVWTKAEYVAFSRPEAQWIVTSVNGTIILTNRETKATYRWDEAFDMLSGSLALRHESGDTYVADGGFKFEIKKVAKLGGASFEDYGDYTKDEAGIGVERTYKVAFNDTFGTTTYIGMDGEGNVLLTRDEANAINFDLQKTYTTDTLKNNGTVDKNTKLDVFHIVNNYMKYNEDTKEWNYTANGDTLAFYRYELEHNGQFLKYNEDKKQFELVTEIADANANKYIYADNFVVKKKEGNVVNIIKVSNADFDNDNLKLDKDGNENIYALKGQLAYEGQKLFIGGKYAYAEKDEKDVNAGEMMFFDFSNGEVQKQTNMYAWNANAQLNIVDEKFDSYRYFATPDTMEFYRVEYSDEFLYEKVQNGINFLGMTYNRDKYNPAIYVDTAYIQNTKKPTYLLALAPEIEPSHKYCPTHGIDPDASVCVPEHQTTIPGYVTARYLVSFTDSVAAHATELKNPYLEDGKYTKLGFVDAVHGVNDVNIIQNGDTVKTYELTDAAAKVALNPVEFAFRIANQETKSFYIESVDNGKVSYIRWQNGVPVLTTDITDAEEFNVRETSENPTANEEISAEEATVSVVATDGAVIVKGAEGKNVIVSTILGKVVANEVVNSDNETTIAAPAGIVVVSVDGESFKVAVK